MATEASAGVQAPDKHVEEKEVATAKPVEEKASQAEVGEKCDEENAKGGEPEIVEATITESNGKIDDKKEETPPVEGKKTEEAGKDSGSEVLVSESIEEKDDVPSAAVPSSEVVEAPSAVQTIDITEESSCAAAEKPAEASEPISSPELAKEIEKAPTAEIAESPEKLEEDTETKENCNKDSGSDVSKENDFKEEKVEAPIAANLSSEVVEKPSTETPATSLDKLELTPNEEAEKAPEVVEPACEVAKSPEELVTVPSETVPEKPVLSFSKELVPDTKLEGDAKCEIYGGNETAGTAKDENILNDDVLKSSEPLKDEPEKETDVVTDEAKAPEIAVPGTSESKKLPEVVVETVTSEVIEKGEAYRSVDAAVAEVKEIENGTHSNGMLVEEEAKCGDVVAETEKIPDKIAAESREQKEVGSAVSEVKEVLLEMVSEAKEVVVSDSNAQECVKEPEKEESLITTVEQLGKEKTVESAFPEPPAALTVVQAGETSLTEATVDDKIVEISKELSVIGTANLVVDDDKAPEMVAPLCLDTVVHETAGEKPLEEVTENAESWTTGNGSVIETEKVESGAALVKEVIECESAVSEVVQTSSENIGKISKEKKDESQVDSMVKSDVISRDIQMDEGESNIDESAKAPEKKLEAPEAQMKQELSENADPPKIDESAKEPGKELEVLEAQMKQELSENANPPNINEETKDATGKTDVQEVESKANANVAAKTSQRSPNIVSKVKHTLVKAKKAIFGKSHSSKTISSETKDEPK